MPIGSNTDQDKTREFCPEKSSSPERDIIRRLKIERAGASPPPIPPPIPATILRPPPSYCGAFHSCRTPPS